MPNFYMTWNACYTHVATLIPDNKNSCKHLFSNILFRHHVDLTGNHAKKGK